MAKTALAAQTWQEVLPGVWRMQIGKADRPTLTDAAGSKPRVDRIEAMPSQPLPFKIESATGVASRDYASARIPLAPGERIVDAVCAARHAVLEGLMTHFASAADYISTQTDEQIEAF